MTRPRLPIVLAVLGALAFARPAIAQDDDDDRPAATAAPAPGAHDAAAQPALDGEQQGAVGIVVAHPRAAKPARAVAAFGLVLDPSALVADAGQLDAARAAERASDADAARVQGLYRGGAGASLKNLQAAQAERARTRAQADAAAATFALHWGALATMAPAARQALVDAVAAGRTLLVRADLLGQRSLGELPHAARLDVDGITVPARVLGVMSQAAPELQSVGVLLRVDAAPRGFGAGARAPVTLEGESRSGVLVPASALVYGEQGVHVYRQVPAKAGERKRRYEAVAVTLRQAQGDAWLVDGLDARDLVVVDGAGVLWSLQGIGAASAGDDDD